MPWEINKVNENELKQELQRIAPQGKIPCHKAFELADKYNLSRSAMGELLNQLRIKIVNCQLGCF
jgi:hypothetical protein